MRTLLTIFTLLTLSSNIFAQSGMPPATKKDANMFFEYQAFGVALEMYKELLKEKPKNVDFNFRLGICYVNTNENKKLGIKPLEFVVKQKKFEPEALFYLAKAYHSDHQFDKAIEYYKKYLAIEKLKPEEIESAQLHIQYSENAKEMVKVPLSISYENLGKNVNTEYPELTPFIPETEEFIAFTSCKKGTTGGDMHREGYSPDVYYTKINRRDKWSRTKSINSMVNTFLPEEAAGISANGDYYIYSSFDLDMNLKFAYKAPKKRSHDKPLDIEAPVSIPNSDEHSATITNDGSILIFSSNREGGFGGFDLYVSKRLPNGGWGQPVNMGSSINTKLDEFYPNLAPDQKTMYFSSNGHTSMGGFDIFKTEFSGASHNWTNPTNIGYPLNTVNDDFTISFNKSGRNAYISRQRAGGFGNLDLWRITINEVQPQYTVFSSEITVYDTYITEYNTTDSLITGVTKKIDSLATDVNNTTLVDSLKGVLSELEEKLDLIDPATGNEIQVIDKQSGTVYGIYAPNQLTGKFVMILEPGSYELVIDNPGYNKFTKNITVLDKVNFVPEKDIEVILHKGELDQPK